MQGSQMKISIVPDGDHWNLISENQPVRQFETKAAAFGYLASISGFGVMDVTIYTPEGSTRRMTLGVAIDSGRTQSERE